MKVGAFLSAVVGGALGEGAFLVGGLPALVVTIAAMAYFGFVMPRLIEWEGRQ